MQGRFSGSKAAFLPCSAGVTDPPLGSHVSDLSTLYRKASPILDHHPLSMILSPKPHPRRSNRVMSTHKHDDASVSMPLSLPLPSAATFHAPPTSARTEANPILHIPSLPDRSLTSPQALEQLVQMSECAIDDIINKFDNSFLGLLGKSQDTEQGLTSPAYLEDKRYSRPPSSKALEHTEHRFCDSGLGSSLASSLCEETPSNLSKFGTS